MQLSAVLGVALHDRTGTFAAGMAIVYLAEDMKHDRKVAIKVFRPDIAAAIGADRYLKGNKVAANLAN